MSAASVRADDRVSGRLSGRTSTWLVLTLAAVVRLIYWRTVHGPLYGADSRQFIRWSSLLAQGDFREPMLYPLHQMYSLFLVPMHLFGTSVPVYVLGLHLILSLVTVWCVMLSARLLVSQTYAIVVGVLAGVNPDVVFWTPYILTETQFLCALAVFLWVFLLLLGQPTGGRLVAYASTAIFLLLSRPVAFPIVAISLAVVFYRIARPRAGGMEAVTVCTAAAVLAIGGMAVALAVPSVRTAIFRNGTVVQSLWLSTRVSSNNIDEILTMQEAPPIAGASDDDMWAFKLAYAKEFIADHPLLYLGMGVKRFFSFWFPWLFARWSLPHRILDAALSLGVTLGALFSCIPHIRNRPMFLTVAAFALSLGLLTAFSQIDSDGRYRLPAEFLLLTLAPAGWIWVCSPLPRNPAVTC